MGDVDLAAQHGADQAVHLGGQVLAVGVEGDDDVGAGVGHQPVAGAKRGAAAAVDHVARDRDPVLAGDVAGAVPRAVVDDERPRSRDRTTSAGMRASTWPRFSSSL